MSGKTSTHYQRLVAAFAASAFALLGLLSSMQYEANTVSAEVVRNSNVLTNYRANGCLIRAAKTKRARTTGNYHLCTK